MWKGGRLMAVRKREEIMESLRARIGDATDDETLAFLEDMTDTFNDYEERVKGDGVDWKGKYEENDRTWREKYRERFFGGTGEKEIPPDGMEDIASPDGDGDKSPKHYEELFKTEG